MRQRVEGLARSLAAGGLIEVELSHTNPAPPLLLRIAEASIALQKAIAGPAVTTGGDDDDNGDSHTLLLGDAGGGDGARELVSKAAAGAAAVTSVEVWRFVRAFLGGKAEALLVHLASCCCGDNQEGASTGNPAGSAPLFAVVPADNHDQGDDHAAGDMQQGVNAVDVEGSLAKWDALLDGQRASAVHVTAEETGNSYEGTGESDDYSATNQYACENPLACALALFDGKLSVLRHALQHADAVLLRLAQATESAATTFRSNR